MSKSDLSIQLIEASELVRSPNQEERVRKKSDMPVCSGTSMSANCNINPELIQVMFKGYDGKDRCERCNRIHGEEVFKEAGDAAPNVEPVFVEPMLATKAEQERRRQILNEATGRMGKDYGGQIVDTGGRPMSSEPEFMTPPKDMTPTERRNEILKKYGITK